MSICPEGHESSAADYCDECGAAMGGRAGAALLAGADPASAPSGGAVPASGSSGGTPASATDGAGEPCPQCATPRAGRFCEVCGFDFVLAQLLPSGQAATPDQAVPIGGPPADVPGGVPTEATPAEHGHPAPDASSPASGGWRLIATADPAFHARMRASAGPDAEQVDLPAFYPPRRFTLSGDQVLIGRHSRSRGVAPDVDLTGPPTDVGVSHTHALLVARTQGGWQVVDLGSANGTYLNDATDPLVLDTPVPVDDGDRIHVGAWTTLTLRHQA